MNGPLERLRRLISGSDEKVCIRDYAVQHYLQCVDEWNAHYFEDDWCDSSRGSDCKAYIEWFQEYYR